MRYPPDPLRDYRAALEAEKELLESERRRLENERMRHELRNARVSRIATPLTTLLTTVTTLVAVATLAFNMARDRGDRVLASFQANARQLATSSSTTERQLALQSLEPFARNPDYRRNLVALLVGRAADERDPVLLDMMRDVLLATHPDSAMIGSLLRQNASTVDSLAQHGIFVLGAVWNERRDSTLLAFTGDTTSGARHHVAALRRRLDWNVALLQQALGTLRAVPAIAFDNVLLSRRTIHSSSGVRDSSSRLVVVGPVFENVDLNGVSFSQADLAGAIFAGVRLRGASFIGVNLAGARLYDVTADSGTHFFHSTTKLTIPTGGAESDALQADPTVHVAAFVEGGVLSDSVVADLGSTAVAILGTTVTASATASAPATRRGIRPGNGVCATTLSVFPSTMPWPRRLNSTDEIPSEFLHGHVMLPENAPSALHQLRCP